MKEIPLTQGYIAFVSDRVYDQLNDRSWHIKFIGGNCYAIRQPGIGKTVFMHREIMGLSSDDRNVVDHIDHDTLNNVDENLRIVTRQQNCCNRIEGLNNKSGFLGVFYDKARNKWTATVSYKRKTVYRKRFTTFEEAKTARIEAERKYYGEYAPQRNILIVKK